MIEIGPKKRAAYENKSWSGTVDYRPSRRPQSHPKSIS